MTDYCNKRSPASAEQPERADPRILLSLELLQGKRLDAKGLVEISAQLHMSPSRWRHLFKRDTGLPPARWYKLRRMRQAKQLLEESFLSVKEIASIVDFADVSHFVRDFKNIYGRTPKQVRIVRLRTLTGGRETIEGSSMG